MTPATARGAVVAVAARPELWWTALRTLRRLAAPGWWHRPSLPLPDSRLWTFRMVTMYGKADTEPSPHDVVTYLAWCRSADQARAADSHRGRSRGMDPRGTSQCG
jgi:hypothetical protein